MNNPKDVRVQCNCGDPSCVTTLLIGMNGDDEIKAELFITKPGASILMYLDQFYLARLIDQATEALKKMEENDAI